MTAITAFALIYFSFKEVWAIQCIDFDTFELPNSAM